MIYKRSNIDKTEYWLLSISVYILHSKHKNTKYYVLISKIFKNMHLLKMYSRICKNEYVLFYSGSYGTCSFLHSMKKSVNHLIKFPIYIQIHGLIIIYNYIQWNVDCTAVHWHESLQQYS